MTEALAGIATGGRVGVGVGGGCGVAVAMVGSGLGRSVGAGVGSTLTIRGLAIGAVLASGPPQAATMTMTADATTSACRHTVFVASGGWLTASGE